MRGWGEGGSRDRAGGAGAARRGRDREAARRGRERSGRAPPSGPGADPAPRPGLGSQPGASLGEGRSDAAEPTLTTLVEAETRGAPERVVQEGRSDVQHN